MEIDRRRFAGAVLVGASMAAAGLAQARVSRADEAGAAALRATLMVDAASGKVLHRSGVTGQRFSPCSTFKIPLGLMGFDAEILKDAHSPAWDYVAERHGDVRALDRTRVDPTLWESQSVVWYSQELTRRLGAARFKAYVDRFGYGNRDVRGNPGRNDGLTQSWLMSSLVISPDEQVAFLRRMLAHRLVSRRAHALTEAVLPQFAGSGGWRVTGKTGSGSLDLDGRDAGPLGWFVGWADNGGRRVIFAAFGAGTTIPIGQAGGPATRDRLLPEFGGLAG